ncbi:MAG: hypothetical protein GY679_00905, partial [Mycoplasma sp.]|nr:hypothetical protein [Mycoplasma sp.]
MKKYKFKKITFISSFIVIVAPVATVVSCGAVKKNVDSKIKKDVDSKIKDVDSKKIATKGGISTALSSVGFKGYNGRGRIEKASTFNGMLNFLHVSMRVEGKTENFSNGDVVKFVFTPVSGYTWDDGTRTPVTLSKKVTGLSSKPKGQTHTNF